MYMNTYRMEGESKDKKHKIGGEKQKEKRVIGTILLLASNLNFTEFYVNISLLNLRSLHQQENH